MDTWFGGNYWEPEKELWFDSIPTMVVGAPRAAPANTQHTIGVFQINSKSICALLTAVLLLGVIYQPRNGLQWLEVKERLMANTQGPGSCAFISQVLTIENGVFLNSNEYQSLSPPVVVITCTHSNSVSLLLHAGVDRGIKGGKQKTAVEWARVRKVSKVPFLSRDMQGQRARINKQLWLFGLILLSAICL